VKAIKITTDNVISVVEVPEPTWKGMGELVGGYFEHVRPWGFMNLDVPEKEKLCMIVNGDGYALELDFNQTASMLYNAYSSRKETWWSVLGDVLIMAEGFVNGEPDIVGLDDEQIQALCKELKNKFKFLKEVINE